MSKQDKNLIIQMIFIYFLGAAFEKFSGLPFNYLSKFIILYFGIKYTKVQNKTGITTSLLLMAVPLVYILYIFVAHRIV
jgi:hypothetical protein